MKVFSETIAKHKTASEFEASDGGHLYKREIAKPDEVWKMLGLKGNDAVNY
jgi:hypothetical protein